MCSIRHSGPKPDIRKNAPQPTASPGNTSLIFVNVRHANGENTDETPTKYRRDTDVQKITNGPVLLAFTFANQRCNTRLRPQL